MKKEYINELLTFAKEIKTKGAIGKRRLKISQIQAIDDIVGDIVYDWIRRDVHFKTDMDFKRMMWMTVWKSLQESNCKFRKYYSQTYVDENTTPEKALYFNKIATINGQSYGEYI